MIIQIVAVVGDTFVLFPAKLRGTAVRDLAWAVPTSLQRSFAETALSVLEAVIGMDEEVESKKYEPAGLVASALAKAVVYCDFDSILAAGLFAFYNRAGPLIDVLIKETVGLLKDSESKPLAVAFQSIQSVYFRLWRRILFC